MEASADTRDALIQAAGELFGARGYDGTSVRAIVERAGANIASVNYHFGSKEGLYLEVLAAAAREEEDLTGLLERVRAATRPDQVGDVLRDLMDALFRQHLGAGRPLWKQQVVMRSFLRPSAALEKVVREVFIPQHEIIREVVQTARPEFTLEEAEMCSFTVTAEVFFYSFARSPLLMYLGEDRYRPGFIERAAHHAAEVVMRSIGLPVPSPGKGPAHAPAEREELCE